jgi:hypothetical protein
MMEKTFPTVFFKCCASTVPYETTITTVEQFQKPDSAVERQKYKTIMF